MNRNNIKMIIMDVDGTLTDGKLYFGPDGEIFKTFNAKDGLRIRQLPQFDIIPVIITGRSSQILATRAMELNIFEIHQGVNDKKKILYELLQRYNLSFDNIAYIGDDENDYSCMNLCGLKGCPADAVEAIISISDFVSKRNGGQGAVREFLDYILLDKLKDHSMDCEYQ